MTDPDHDGRLVRALGAGLSLVGVAHLLVPGRLLGIVRRGYRLLNVEFRAQDGARRRVRLVGILLVAAGAHLLYHGGIVPRWFRDDEAE